MTSLLKSNPLSICIVAEDAASEGVKSTISSSFIPVKAISVATNLRKAKELVRRKKPDIVFLSLSLPDYQGVAAYLELKDLLDGSLVVILTDGSIDMRATLESIQLGAHDYLVKGEFDEKLLEKTIDYNLERRQSEEKLRLANERYQLVLKATHDLVWDWDLLTNEIYRDESAVKKVYGVSSNEIIKLPGDIGKFLHPDDKDGLYASIAAIRNSKENDFFQLEYRLLSEDGQYKNIYDRGYVVRDADRAPIRLLGAAQDITEWKKTQLELEKLSMIARETNNAVIITNEKEEIQWVNEAFTRMTGYSFPEVKGKTPGSFLQGQESSPEIKERIRKAIADAESFEVEMLNYSKTGKKYWVRIECQPIFDADNKLIRFFSLQTDITEQKRAREELVKRERRFRSLIENSADGIMLVGADKRVMDISSSVTRILGYEKKMYTGVDRTNFVHPDYQHVVDSAFEAVVKDPLDIRVIEYKFRRSDGEYVWIESSFHNQLNAPGVAAVVLNFREVTARKNQEEELRRQQSLFRALVEKSPDMKVMTTADGKITYGTGAITRVLGYTEAEFTGAHEKNVIHPLDWETFVQERERVLADPEYTGRIEIRLRHKDGHYLWCEKVLSNLLNDPHVNAVVCNFWNITGKREAELKILESEEKYRALFHDNPLPMFLFEIDTMQIRECNNAALDKYGYSREEFLSMNVLDIRPDEDHKRVLKIFADRTALNKTTTSISQHLKKSGELMTVELFFGSVEYGGKIVRQVQVNDITEKVRLAKELEQARQQSQHMITEATILGQEKEREQLGLELHDNINQILATAKLFLDYALSEPTVKTEIVEKSRSYILQATEEIRRLSKTLIPPSLDNFGLLTALDELSDSIEMAGSFRINRIWNQFCEDKMSKDQKLTIYRIVQEQLNNIIKHAAATRVDIILQNGQLMQLEIVDNGKGFDTAGRRNGVGLRNIMSRAELFSGKVLIDSSLGKGCRVRVIFPGHNVKQHAG